MDADTDRHMMMRCIALSKASGEAGEYPYGAVICRNGTIVAESINMVSHDGDVTRHAEVVAISKAQKTLRTVSLDDCEIYVNAEPCAMCSLAIRETRMRRVVYGLSSPHMGGVSKWKILGDNDISNVMPEVFAPPPEIVSGYMAEEAEKALIEWNPLIARIIATRGLFGVAPLVITPNMQHGSMQRSGLRTWVSRFLRRNLFDYFGRR
ncbi:MAG: nucleoside deaminase [bacterium]